jgi:hypothetical protein
MRVRMYQVGFGDCFLITVEYPKPLADQRTERHILVDFGSTHGPKGDKPTMREIAADICTHVGNQLDVLIVTHRHKDHLSAFGQKGLTKYIDLLQPQLLIRPWTDDPTAARDATGTGERLAAGSRSFAQGLALKEATIETLQTQLVSIAGARSRVARAAADQLPSPEALAKLEGWAKRSAFDPWYVRADEDLDLNAVVPGVSAHVLGPPTLEQAPGLATAKREDDEFWVRSAQLLAAPMTPGRSRRSDDALRILADPDRLGAARWLIERLNKQGALNLFQIVRLFDDALNNTSVVLLLRVGDRTILLSGDAQIENWQYTLDLLPRRRTLRDALADVDLYKVGHHGSRNATPKSLFALWQQRPSTRPLMTLMSTRPGVHGDSPETRVPRQTLIDALETRGTLLRTDTLSPGQLYVECEASCNGRARFAQVI